MNGTENILQFLVWASFWRTHCRIETTQGVSKSPEAGAHQHQSSPKAGWVFKNADDDDIDKAGEEENGHNHNNEDKYDDKEVSWRI